MASKINQKTKRQAIVILGMHRSGTSALSGALTLLGCDGPQTPMPSSDANSKGFFESQKIYELHGRLLDSAGSFWADWNAVTRDWFATSRAEEFQEQAIEVLREEFAGSRLFVLKDPRVCRLVPFWYNALEHNDCTPLSLHVHRNPRDVALSLMRHHDLSLDSCMLLWLRHVLDAERFTRGRPRHFLSYARFLQHWEHEVSRLQNGLGIILPRQSPRVRVELTNFLEKSLRHFDTEPEKVIDDPSVMEWIRTCYAIFEQWSSEGEQVKDYAILDRILHDFDLVAPFLSTSISDRDSARRKLRQLETSESDLRKQITSLETQATAETDARIAALETERDAILSRQADSEAVMRDTIAKLEESTKRESELEQILIDEQNAARQMALDVETLENQLQRLNDELAQTHSRVRQQEAEQDASANELKVLTQKATEAAEAHDKAMAQQADKLFKAHKRNGELEKERLEDAKRFAHMEQNLATSQTHIVDLENRHQKRFHEIAILTRLVKEMESEMAAERSHREKVEYANMALQTSSSWRFTAPLRKLTSLFRRS